MPALLLLTGPSAGMRFELRGETTLGRSPSCEVPLDDERASRRHAKIRVVGDEVRISDLNSRNGTRVNGEKLDGEAVLLSGDRIEVGATTAVYEPEVRASFVEDSDGELKSSHVEELLPRVGPEEALLSAGVAFIGATSEAMVLRRAAESLQRALSADRSAAFLGGAEGLFSAAVLGADSVEVPRGMARAALEAKEGSRGDRALCAPLVGAGGRAFGLLYAERDKRFSDPELRLAAAVGRLAGEAYAAAQTHGEDRGELIVVGASRQFRRMMELIRRAALGSAPVFLHGENGTGKSLPAAYIHARSPAALGPRVVVDCREKPGTVEETLFGRAGAPGIPPRPSALLRADGGTLLLKHVEALAPAVAARLGKHLEKGSAPRAEGGEEPVKCRVIATGSLPRERLLSLDRLEPHLGHALAGSEIELIPLRDRRPDVPALFDVFAGRMATKLGRTAPALSPEARRLLVDYGWAGNVRELRLLAERLAALYSGADVGALHLPPEIQSGDMGAKTPTLSDRVARLEREAITEALREARGKKIRAAEILGISRPTLDKKIAEYQLEVNKRQSRGVGGT